MKILKEKFSVMNITFMLWSVLIQHSKHGLCYQSLCVLAESSYENKLLVRALIDSSASHSCISRNTAERLTASKKPCDEFIVVNLLRKQDLKWVASFPPIVMDRLTGIQEPVRVSPLT